MVNLILAKNKLLILILLLFLYGCGGGNNDTTVDKDLQRKSGNYFPKFGGKDLVGLWRADKIEDNGSVKESDYPLKYQYDNYGKLYLHISIINKPLPIGDYYVNEEQNIVWYEINSTKDEFVYIEDFNNTCIKVQERKVYESNQTIEDKGYLRLCKEL